MDMDFQADEAWILNVQRKLYQWSQENPGDQWRDMWGWLTDIRTLRCAWRRVASNRGARTPGVDGMTVKRIRAKLGVNCAPVHIGPARPDAFSSPRPENQESSDPWA